MLIFGNLSKKLVKRKNLIKFFSSKQFYIQKCHILAKKCLVINILTLSLVCFWIWALMLGNENYQLIYNFFNSFFGKFFVICFIWSYSFQILSEVRHWFWDLGYGFELTTSKITGFIVIIGSIFFTIIIYSFRGVLI